MIPAQGVQAFHALLELRGAIFPCDVRVFTFFPNAHRLHTLSPGPGLTRLPYVPIPYCTHRRPQGGASCCGAYVFSLVVK